MALFIRALEGGGAQRDAVLLANALAARGNNIAILTLKPKGALTGLVARDVGVVHVPAGSLRTCLPALRGTIMGLAPGILLSSEAAQNVLTALTFATIRGGVRPRLVLREVTSPTQALRHDPYLQNRLAYRVLGLASAQADCVLTLTQGARADLIANFKVPPERIAVLRSNAVIDDETAVRLAAFDGETGRQPGLILAVGRLSPEKDHATLIEAMARLPRDLPARLVIAGDGPMRGALEARIEALGLKGRITLAGQISDPFAWQMRAALCVSSSRFEGLGNAIIEALSCGTPVVATDCPFGPREILEGGRYGRLVPVAEPEHMAQAIVEALKAPVDRSALRSRAAGYTTKAAAQALVQILTERKLVGTGFALH